MDGDGVGSGERWRVRIGALTSKRE